MALRVVRALFDGVRDGLLVFFVGVVLFRAATIGDLLTVIFVAATVRVVAEASITAVSCLTIHTMRGRRGGVAGQRGGADGTGREDHLSSVRS